MDNQYLEKLIAIEERSKSNTKRINAHEEQIAKLTDVHIALTKVTDKVDNIEKIVVENKNDIKDMKEKPAKRMDAIWGYIVAGIITGLITFTFTVLGLKG